MQSVGDRIKQTRLAHGWSLRELASLAAPLSATAISRYENGQDVPGSEVLLRLAKAFEVKFEYFFRPVTVRLAKIEHRKRSFFPEKQKTAIEHGAIEELERYLAAEDLFGPDAFQPFSQPKACEVLITCIEDAEEAARCLREEWLGDDPIDDLCEVLEDRGVKVILVEAARGYDGFAGWAERNGERVPIIGVRSDPEFGDRQRLSMAHELGHLILRFGPDADHKFREAAAFRFGAAFLVPGGAVRAQFPNPVQHLSLQVLYSLKHKWGLSMAAWTRRLYDLSIITKSTYERFCMKFKSTRGVTGETWWDREPGESQVKPELPRRFHRLVEQAVAQDIISTGRAADLLGKSLIEVRRDMKWPQEAEAL